LILFAVCHFFQFCIFFSNNFVSKHFFDNFFFSRHFYPFRDCLIIFFFSILIFGFSRIHLNCTITCKHRFLRIFLSQTSKKTAQLEIQTQTKVKSRGTSKAKVNCVYDKISKKWALCGLPGCMCAFSKCTQRQVEIYYGAIN
jgi:hypothetical protein